MRKYLHAPIKFDNNGEICHCFTRIDYPKCHKLALRIKAGRQDLALTDCFILAGYTNYLVKVIDRWHTEQADSCAIGLLHGLFLGESMCQLQTEINRLPWDFQAEYYLTPEKLVRDYFEVDSFTDVPSVERADRKRWRKAMYSKLY